jgi:serine protease AprX
VPNTDSTGGHGTHVAGIVGATGEKSGGKYEGVAPGADLVGYGSGAGLLLLDVIGGFDYALTHQKQYGIRVVTNSWGTTSDRCTDVDPDDPINVATKDSYDRNIVVVFSAGNSGPDTCTITGNYKKAPWVILAAGDRGRELTEFSSRGSAGCGGTFRADGRKWTWKDQPTLTAPGVDVVSTRTTR